jgi:hypothetical protein
MFFFIYLFRSCASPKILYFFITATGGFSICFKIYQSLKKYKIKIGLSNLFRFVKLFEIKIATQNSKNSQKIPKICKSFKIISKNKNRLVKKPSKNRIFREFVDSFSAVIFKSFFLCFMLRSIIKFNFFFCSLIAKGSWNMENCSRMQKIST